MKRSNWMRYELTGLAALVALMRAVSPCLSAQQINRKSGKDLP
jgi:hypothetical protein